MTSAAEFLSGREAVRKLRVVWGIKLTLGVVHEKPVKMRLRTFWQIYDCQKPRYVSMYTTWNRPLLLKLSQHSVFSLNCNFHVILFSYIGKGFILAPPKTVWDAIRNPRTRFTYDDTLKVQHCLDYVWWYFKGTSLPWFSLENLVLECLTLLSKKLS